MFEYILLGGVVLVALAVMLFRALPEAPPSTPRQRAANSPPAASIVDFEMEYADANGEITTRRILVTNMDGTAAEDGAVTDVTRLRAFCMLRRDEREFLTARILRLRPNVRAAWISDPDGIRGFLIAATNAAGDAGRLKVELKPKQRRRRRAEH